MRISLAHRAWFCTDWNWTWAESHFEIHHFWWWHYQRSPFFMDNFPQLHLKSLGHFRHLNWMCLPYIMPAKYVFFWYSASSLPEMGINPMSKSSKSSKLSTKIQVIHQNRWKSSKIRQHPPKSTKIHQGKQGTVEISCKALACRRWLSSSLAISSAACAALRASEARPKSIWARERQL